MGDAMTNCCWKDLNTGEFLCDQPAEFRVFQKDCPDCIAAGHAECVGGDVCETHAMQERAENPDVIRVTSLQAVSA